MLKRTLRLGAFLTLFVVVASSTLEAQGQGGPPSGGIAGLEARVAALEVETVAQADRISTLEAQTAAQAALIASLQAENAAQGGRIADLEGNQGILLSVLSVNGDGDLVVSGANLLVQSGSGATNGVVNGKGNVIIGYDEADANDSKLGSHNLVIGSRHTYTSFGGLVAGFDNELAGAYASVSGGSRNRAAGFAASVSGGVLNTAGGPEASVSGGVFNIANGGGASVSGGQQNIAAGNDSSISGGIRNTASGFLSSISGGVDNTASGSFSSVSGGRGCVRALTASWGAGVSLGKFGVFPTGLTADIVACP